MAHADNAKRMTHADLKRYLSIWPSVMREVTDDWAKEFALSIWRQSGEPQWFPTVKQSRVMRQLARKVAAFSALKGRTA